MRALYQAGLACWAESSEGQQPHYLNVPKIGMEGMRELRDHSNA
jgi:hypothetical protein